MGDHPGALDRFKVGEHGYSDLVMVNGLEHRHTGASMRLQIQRSAGDPATVAAAVRDAALVLVAVQQVDQRMALDRERPAPTPSEVAELRDAARAAGARLAGLTDGGSAVLLEYLRAARAHLAGRAGTQDAIHVATHELWRCFDRPIAALVGFCANADVDLTRSLDAPGPITLCSTDDFIVCCCRLAEQGAYATWPSVAMALRHTMQLMISTHAAMDAAYPDAAV
jgi:hypothetical protein